MPKVKGERSQGLALFASLAAIGVLWSITPLSYLYVIWSVASLWFTGSASHAGHHHPTHSTWLSIRHVVHFLILAYAALGEVPFSVYYRYLALRANRRWTQPLERSADVRNIFKRCLETGLDRAEGGDDEDPLDSLLMGENPDGMEDSNTTLRRRVGGRRPTLTNPDFDLHKDDPRALDFREHLRAWFYSAPFSEIRHGNIASWLSWSLYAQPYEELLAERNSRSGDSTESDSSDDGSVHYTEHDKLSFVVDCVRLVEARVGCAFPAGINTKVKEIRLTLDPVKVTSRPLLLYLFVMCMQKLAISRAQGFTEYKDGDTRYLLRMPKGWTPDPTCEATRPLLFIHGLGMGVAQYSGCLSYLGVSPDLARRPVCVLIQPAISMSFFDRAYLRPPTKEESTKGLLRMCQRWGFDKSKLTVLSHSNGSIVHGWLVKTYPGLVVRSAFVDPVCFCLWEGSVCVNFLYKHSRTPIDYLMRYFVSRELGVAFVLQRSFQWSSNLLFPSQIPNFKSKYHVAFFLAGADQIVDTARVHRHLLEYGVQDGVRGPQCGGIIMDKDKGHGGSLVDRGVMDWISRENEPEMDGDVDRE